MSKLLECSYCGSMSEIYMHPDTDKIYILERVLGQMVLTTFNDSFFINDEWLSKFIYIGVL